jgi:hypothetical protein
MPKKTMTERSFKPVLMPAINKKGVMVWEDSKKHRFPLPR